MMALYDQVPDVEDIGRIVDQIKPLLAGVATATVGAVLGDLVAMFIAGHRVEDTKTGTENAQRTKTIQEHVLEMHIGLVRELIPVNAAMIDAQTGLPRRKP